MNFYSIIVAIALCALPLASPAATIVQVQNAANDTFFPNWNTAALWDGGLAPSPGNNYVTEDGFVAPGTTELGVTANVTGRVRENGTTFGGDSFRIVSNSELLLKQAGGQTSSGNVILDGGILRLAPNSTGSAILAGTLQIASDSVIGVVQNSINTTTLNITSALSGSGDLRVAAGSGINHVVSFQGDLSAYNGTINVGGGFQRVTANFAQNYFLPNLSLAYDDFSTEDRLDLTHDITLKSFTFDGTALEGGSYTVAQLNGLFGNGSQFLGDGILSIMVPEPGTLSLLGIACTFLLAMRRRLVKTNGCSLQGGNEWRLQ